MMALLKEESLFAHQVMRTTWKAVKQSPEARSVHQIMQTTWKGVKQSPGSYVIQKQLLLKEGKFSLCFIDYNKDFDCVSQEKLWLVLKDMAVPQHLSVLLCNLYSDYR